MDHSDGRSSKRRRLEQEQEQDKSVQQDTISDSNQLHQLLRFKQSTSSDVRIAVNKFKDFLSATIKTENLATKSRSLQILRQYCNTQSASTQDDLDFSDLISTWSFAVQSNNDPICSAVPAALAQFYKTISGILEFREFGLSLGHTLLKREQVRLLDRGFSASRTKEHLISPCLRLLTEVISFDGGALASRAFNHRDILFRRLDFLLDQKNTEDESDRRRPSVRRMALRLVIANLKLLDGSAKIEFAMHHQILRTCLRGATLDGDDIVVDLLKSIDTGLVEDKEISRVAKSRIMNQDNLRSLSLLYNYASNLETPNSSTRVRDAVHDLLLKICTTRKGILLSQNGWYPIAYETKIETGFDNDHIDLGLESPVYADEYHKNIPVKNTILSVLAQDLKPQDDTLQSTLLLQILRSAPELVADFFSRRTKLTIPSSDDASWRNYFAFLYSVSQLPIPKNFGWQDDALPGPPPVSIVIESILSRPFDRATLSRYLTSSEEILVLSAARLLTVALHKLQNVIDLYDQQTTSGAWQQAVNKLVEAMLQRVPKLQEIIHALQHTGKGNESVRLAIFECLLAYHHVLPEAVIGSKFDFGSVLADNLSRMESQDMEPQPGRMLEEHMIYLVKIAQSSQATKWWNKSDSETLSLFSQLFHFAVTQAEGDVASEILKALESVSSLAGVLSTNTASFTALRLSITDSKKFKAGNETWLMLDNALHRAVQRPVKYLDQIEAMQQTLSDEKPLSILAASIAEQWDFVLKKYEGQNGVIKNTSEWIARLCSAFESAGDNFRVMQQLQDNMLKSVKEEQKELFQKAARAMKKHPVSIEASETGAEQEPDDLRTKTAKRSLNLSEALAVSTASPGSLEGIDRWDDKTDIELAIQSGRLTKLLQCTASPEDEIRRQALQSIQRMVHIIDQSNYEEKVQMHLLLGELVQTIRQQDLDTALLSVTTELAIRLLQIVSDPAHKMYGKANKYLLRSPVWNLQRIISYWTREILFQEPESDDAGAWIDEVEWFLQLLINGLRTSADMELYRRSGVFEKVLVIYTKPSLLRTTRRLILSLIWCGVCAGGANTLITRVGILSWLDVMHAQDKEYHGIIEQLGNEIRDACDKERIRSWEGELPALRETGKEQS